MVYEGEGDRCNELLLELSDTHNVESLPGIRMIMIYSLSILFLPFIEQKCCAETVNPDVYSLDGHNRLEVVSVIASR